MRTAANRRSRFTTIAHRETLAGFLFVSPWLISLILFVAYPVVAATYFSFTEYSLVQPPRFSGLTNFKQVFTSDSTFVTSLGNSVFYAGSVTIGTVLSSTMVAYGFARLRFPGRNLLFSITLGTMMIPSMVTFIPTYVLFKVAGDVLHRQLIGNYFPLIAPAFLGNAIFIFMMRQFFRRLPTELTEAARVDGAGEFRIFWQIMVPLVKPAVLVVAMFSFLWTWHEFFGPLVYLGDNNLYPISLGLFRFKSRYVIDWGPMTAAATMATLPLIALFFSAQRYFLEGISLTGIKG